MRGKNRQKRATNGFVVFKNIGLMLTGSALMLAGVAVIGAGRSGDRWFNRVQSFLNPPPSQPKVETRSVVIQQIRNASELTTAVFTMEAVIPTQQDATVGGFVVGTTRLLYIAYGEVRAGVDLSVLTPESVEMVGETLRLRLPPPKILDSKIDVNRSKVYDYNRGLLGLGPDVAPNLQSLAQKEALKKVKDAACTNGILLQANDRAKLTVTQLIKVPNVKEVVIETQAPASSACQNP
ncbi:DUF4230 domain-containing protein [Phormidesmis priestleyi ULC007]|uniref:DUF4230 domain-containing protein n=1 Tax=Phormidesmis priestleyi ULC007 TaxID=1920490 RepID=A0A2T1DHI7_9CYAN|nr:DUF4230 domain-containing protein [Phormidesmis priestleyi]PSB19936.1 DUF4230 domain-containing protein [Phormidesmis priestleyi ULC007]PZO50366.1 MAG: DUF4230 domain-containing protein [Phormidesmis priestleyi]